jgi:hypothetical protein
LTIFISRPPPCRFFDHPTAWQCTIKRIFDDELQAMVCSGVVHRFIRFVRK